MYKSHSINNRLKAGQAMIELAVGLVALMVLIGALIQIGRLTHAHTLTAERARSALALQMLDGASPAPPQVDQYIYNWHPGPDQRAYTHDDIAVTATNAADTTRLIVDCASVSNIPTIPRNPYATLAAIPNSMGNFALINAKATETVDILPVIRRLVYAGGTLTVESDVWMVGLNGIY